MTLVDVDESRSAVAAALGAGFAVPAEAPGGLDLVVHTSGTSAGLQTSLDLLAPDGEVVELSWYGDAPVSVSTRRFVPLAATGGPGQPGG